MEANVRGDAKWDSREATAADSPAEQVGKLPDLPELDGILQHNGEGSEQPHRVAKKLAVEYCYVLHTPAPRNPPGSYLQLCSQLWQLGTQLVYVVTVQAGHPILKLLLAVLTHRSSAKMPAAVRDNKCSAS